MLGWLRLDLLQLGWDSPMLHGVRKLQVLGPLQGLGRRLDNSQINTANHSLSFQYHPFALIKVQSRPTYFGIPKEQGIAECVRQKTQKK